MAGAIGEDPKIVPPDRDGGTISGQQKANPSASNTNTNTRSYADRLKTNVMVDHKLKRNILEITIEKTEKDKKIELEDEMVSRVCSSIGIHIRDQVEGF